MLDKFRAWLERRRAIQEMLALEREEVRELRLSDKNPLIQAKISLEIDDPETALRYWNQAWSRYPTYVKQSPETIEILLRLKLFDAAEAIMLEGKKRSPFEARYAEGYALVAEQSGNLTEAITRWQHVRKRFPGSWTAHVNAARCLGELRRFDEAEVLLKQATSRFPFMIQSWIEYARVAENTMKWDQAGIRWQQVRLRFEHPMGAVGEAHAMVERGLMDEAERFLLDMRTTFEYDSEIAASWANLAERRGDLELALKRWTAVRKRFPQFIVAFRESARLLEVTGKMLELEKFLRDAADRFPAEESFGYQAHADGESEI